MKSTKIAAIIGMMVLGAQAAIVYQDNFDTIDPSVWTGGALHSASIGTGHMKISNWGTGWAIVGNGAGAGISINKGLVTFRVRSDGVNPVAGTFQLGNQGYWGPEHKLAKTNLQRYGAGYYELVFNNTGTDGMPFMTPSGIVGTIDSGWSVSFVNGAVSTDWYEKAGAPIGGSADQFGFWFGGLAGTTYAAVIDDMVIYDCTVVPEPAPIGLLGLISGGIYFTRRFFIA